MRLIGRMVALTDSFLRLLRNRTRQEHSPAGVGRESTGIHTMPGIRPPQMPNTREIVLIDYDDASHTLWRAQEFTLFTRDNRLLAAPILDLGCGDGSFSSILFDNLEYGVDPDPNAIAIAKTLGLYRNLLNRPAEDTQLPSNSIRSVFSNSVLEHATHLGSIIKEMSRIMMRDGIFMLSVPNEEFTKSMGRLFGAKEARRLNEDDFFHRNLLSNEEWIELLKKHDFRIMKLQNYQPDRLNFVFRMLRSPLIRRLNKIRPIWSERDLLDLVDDSLRSQKGGGTFIIAKKGNN
jgi:2-polyprenyl-3-methyl-5-hydroxy-6-metoxy-1,4-benzoquinol methylase